MHESDECPGTHLVFSQNEHGQWQLVCGETGDVFRTFKDWNDAMQYGIYLVSEHGPWNIEIKKQDKA
ncbi:MAG: hypothetical protein M1274_05785 [Actinobacteria bacterium]|nr:hypothetical protein [Actinomycetota bacterium]